PHQICTCFIVFRLFNCNGTVLDTDLKQSFSHIVGYFNILVNRVISLENVAHNIGSSRCCVPLVYAVSVNRVEHREYRTQCRVAHWTLILSFFVADNSAAIHFRPCSSQGQDRTQWQRILNSGLSNHKVPYISVIGNTCSNSLGSIDNATATHCKDEVHLVLTAKGYSLANRRHAGIGLNTSELYIKDIVLLKQSGKLVVQPYTFN